MEGIKKITGSVQIDPITEEDVKKEIKNVFDFKTKLEKSLNKKTSDLVEIILAGAFYLDGSDIHIEAEQEKAKFRIRIDGALQDVIYFEPKVYKAVLGRIKLLSELKLNITNRPQDGRFSILLDNMSIEIRTSLIPSEYGESLVLRILNPKWVVTMNALGLRNDMYEVFKKEIRKPNGMIITTGPTGSGKSTTLYAFLQEIINPEIKIITIEDPIEYHLAGTTQNAVDEKNTFPEVLRASLRHDPDVIMVGEIRDFETANIALQASLTGHLVLTTVHTNDSAGTIARFLALGEKPDNISNALNLVIAQRLVRKVCKKCGKEEEASNEDLEKLKQGLKNIPKNIDIPEITKGVKITKAVGCDECNKTGYKGRIGLFESFVVDDEMKRFIFKSPSIPDVRDMAIKKGMLLMYQDGLIKVLKGITTIEEVGRVTGENITGNEEIIGK